MEETFQDPGGPIDPGAILADASRRPAPRCSAAAIAYNLFFALVPAMASGLAAASFFGRDEEAIARTEEFLEAVAPDEVALVHLQQRPSGCGRGGQREPGSLHRHLDAWFPSGWPRGESSPFSGSSPGSRAWKRIGHGSGSDSSGSCSPSGRLRPFCSRPSLGVQQCDCRFASGPHRRLLGRDAWQALAMPLGSIGLFCSWSRCIVSVPLVVFPACGWRRSWPRWGPWEPRSDSGSTSARQGRWEAAPWRSSPVWVCSCCGCI